MTTPVSLRVFAGPKVISVLNSVHATSASGTASGPNIEPILNFGWFGWIAKPLFVVLRFTYDHVVPNWGWSILILTLLLNVLMLPTRITMMKSALKMQRIQPEMQQIKERVQEVQGHRSPPSGHEQGDHGAAEARGRQHVRRLPAHAHPVPAALRLLRDAGERDRAPPRPLALAARSRRARTRSTSCPSSSSSPCSPRPTCRPRRASIRRSRR